MIFIRFLFVQIMTQRGQVKALKFVRIYDRKTLRVTLKKQKRKKGFIFVEIFVKESY